MEKLLEKIRRIILKRIDDSEITAYALFRDAGVNMQQGYKYLRGEGGVSLDFALMLLQHLGYVVEVEFYLPKKNSDEPETMIVLTSVQNKTL